MHRRMTRSAVAGIAVAAALAFGAAIPATAGTSGRPGTARPPLARVWLTTVDGTQRLSDAGTVPFTRSDPNRPADLTVTVDPSRSYQSMQGFGAALTDSSAAVLYRLEPAARQWAAVTAASVLRVTSTTSQQVR